LLAFSYNRGDCIWIFPEEDFCENARIQSIKRLKKEENMKRLIRLAFFLALAMGVSFNLMAQKPADLVGTWVGLATLEGMDEPNEFTLVLEMKDGSLAGHMTDQYGSMTQAAIAEIKLEDGVFSFSVVATGPGGEETTLVLKMNVEGDSMKGTLEIPDMGMNGAWEATKQK
jgi:hypothetical protein